MAVTEATSPIGGGVDFSDSKAHVLTLLLYCQLALTFHYSYPSLNFNILTLLYSLYTFYKPVFLLELGYRVPSSYSLNSFLVKTYVAGY